MRLFPRTSTRSIDTSVTPNGSGITATSMKIGVSAERSLGSSKFLEKKECEEARKQTPQPDSVLETAPSDSPKQPSLIPKAQKPQQNPVANTLEIQKSNLNEVKSFPKKVDVNVKDADSVTQKVLLISC